MTEWLAAGAAVVALAAGVLWGAAHPDRRPTVRVVKKRWWM